VAGRLVALRQPAQKGRRIFISAQSRRVDVNAK